MMILVELVATVQSKAAHLRIRGFGLALVLFAASFHNCENRLPGPSDEYLALLGGVSWQNRHIEELSGIVTLPCNCCSLAVFVLHGFSLVKGTAELLSSKCTSL